MDDRFVDLFTGEVAQKVGVAQVFGDRVDPVGNGAVTLQEVAMALGAEPLVGDLRVEATRLPQLPQVAAVADSELVEHEGEGVELAGVKGKERHNRARGVAGGGEEMAHQPLVTAVDARPVGARANEAAEPILLDVDHQYAADARLPIASHLVTGVILGAQRELKLRVERLEEARVGCFESFKECPLFDSVDDAAVDGIAMRFNSGDELAAALLLGK